jgi:uncharacterized protein (DUF3084 family)
LNPTDIVKVAADTGLSPSVQMILVLVAILLALSAPAMLFLRDWKKNGKVNEVEGKNGDIQSGLYAHLYEQVTALTLRLDKIHDEYNGLVKENAELRARVSALESCEALVKKLQTKLDQKDDIIIARDTQLNVLFSDLRLRDQKIIELQERVNVLEVFNAKGQKHGG